MDRFESLLIGDAPILVHCAEILLARGHGVAAVVTAHDGIIDWAGTHGVAVIAPGAGLDARLAGIAFDWLFNIGGLSLIGADVIARARAGTANFHDGPLPRHGGLNAPVWAMLAGETDYGVTWHRIARQVDAGEVLVQHPVTIAPDDTALSLNTKCMAAGIEAFGALVDGIERGTLQGVPQDRPVTPLHRRADRPACAGMIDFQQPAADAARLVRALDHGPYWNPLTLPKIARKGAVLCVGRAEPAEGAGTPGAVLAVEDDALTVACADGALRLSALRCQHGRAAVVPAFATPGDTLDRPDPALTAALAGVVRDEDRWRAALGAMAPATLPGVAEATGTPDWQEFALAGGALSPARAAVLLATLALRLTGMPRADIAHRCDGMGTAAPALLADWVPLGVTGAQTLAEAEAQVAATLARLETCPGYPRDLIARDPMLAPPAPPALAMAEAPLPGAALTLIPGAAPKLVVDATRIAPDAAAQLAARLAHMARTAAPDTALSAQEIVTEAERRRLLDEHNASARPYDRRCIHHAFEAQAARTPDATALVFEGQSLSYAELNARANRAAHVLRAMGVGPDQPVGLCTRRGPAMMVGALAILKAGGAYVPMDPAYPADRLAHYLGDSGARVIVTEHAALDALPPHAGALLQLDTDTRLADAPDTAPEAPVGPDNLAYLIYTSGSTGLPKGVMVEHGNVANFFAGMDDRIDHAQGGVWLAVTSLNFDISVLELFWTLARGFKVVIMGEEDRMVTSNAPVPVSDQGMEFSLFYWGNDDGPGPQKYRLLLDGARFADTHGFCAVWTPERHFHAFGGPYPNPAVTGAAVAAVTKNIAVRAGSCVAPLHHPVRIAEEWAVIDNLTGGRTGLGIASGWHPVDFVLRPENRPPDNKKAMFETIDTLRRLWRGEAVDFDKGDGPVPVTTLPRPVQPDLPLWLTIAGNPDTWREAGEIGANVLTHLLGQSIDEVAQKIGIYHQALRDSGRDPADFKVTLMLHTFVARDREHAREVARKPMQDYLLAAAGLVKQYAWAFPAFKRPQGARNPMDIDLSTLSEDEVAGILDYAFNRYFEDSGLFGTVEDCLARVEQLKAIGVAEVACLIDYGIAPETVLEALYPLAEVVRRANAGAVLAETDHSLAAQIARHKVTHFQCTPSMMRMLMADPVARGALARVPNVLIGGEPLPGPLAAEVAALTGAPVQNMYGPTETTIWSSTATTTGGTGTEPIGTPIANTQLYALDPAMRPVPEGVAGELWIGGDGVARGYWRRDDLTAERFRPNPFGPGRIYRTGDLVRRAGDGTLAYLGRADHQIKLRGHRVEPGEIEAALEALPGITRAAVTAREDTPGDLRLVAYYTGTPGADLRTELAAALPAHMVPAHFVPLAAFPLTPNRKIDRQALPAPRPVAVATAPATAAPAAGAGDTQAEIARVWADVLGVDTIGAGDNFFDLGGHSLLAVQAHRTLRARLDLPGLSITDIFRFPVLRDLVAHVDGRLRPQPVAPAAPAAAQPSGAPEVPRPGRPETRPDTRTDAMARRRAMRARRMERT
ncbi:MAG: LLM class flavin-dependent oxidoreductase [Rhodobacteraceae bacterium]|nr:LLM class flavin-dependent oxidoreductase [Paracoccaceae bacterium]